MGYQVSSLDELGEGYGFRKIRKPLGVTAFGVNALVFPPRYEGPNHFHDVQDELYFVHRGTATFTIDGNELVVGLQSLGLKRGDRVATLCWNHYQHHEAYLGIPCGGFVLHTLNLRLHPNDLAYIATHAADRAVIVDKGLLPLLEQFVGQTPI